MSESLTADEVLEQNKSKMGEELGTLYSLLWQELARLHQVWEEYVNLFGTNQSRFDIMNKSAPHFFNIAQQSLWEKVILGIARITDKAEVFGKANVSVHGMLRLIEDEMIKEQYDTVLNNIKKEVAFCRDWRNRIIAHQDLQHQLDKTLKPLLPANRLGIRNALKSLSEALNVVSKHYLNSTTMFDLIGPVPGGAHSLLVTLEDGNKVREEVSAKIKSRNHTLKDLEYLKPRKF